MDLRGAPEAVAVTDIPVVIGEDRGELATIDLREGFTLVEYSGDDLTLVDHASDDLTLVEYTSDDHSRWSVLVALVVLNILDVISTAAVIAAGGTENNPLMRPLVEGIWQAVLLKTVVLVAVAWLLGRCADSRRIALMMAVTTGWYIAVVSWNLAVLGFG